MNYKVSLPILQLALWIAWVLPASSQDLPQPDPEALRGPVRSVVEQLDLSKGGRSAVEQVRTILEQEFDSSGSLLRSVSTGTDGKAKLKQSAVLDGEGRVIGMEQFDARSASSGRIEYQCDSTGDLTESRLYDGASVLQERTVYGYNARGSRAGSSTFNGAGIETVRVTYSHDLAGRVVEITMLELSEGSRQKFTRLTFDYDTAGRLASRKTYIDILSRYTSGEFRPKLTRSEEFNYNEVGALASQNMVDSLSGRNEHDEYIVDGYGNWIEKRVTRNPGGAEGGRLTAHYRRTIIYFTDVARAQSKVVMSQ